MSSRTSFSAHHGRLILFFCIALVATSFLAHPTNPVAFHHFIRSSVRLGTSARNEETLPLCPTIKSLYINIGAGLSPLAPPSHDRTVGVIAIEPNIAIAHNLRENFQKLRYPFRFHVINCAIGKTQQTGHFSALHYSGVNGANSSLKKATQGGLGLGNSSVHSAYGPGSSQVDFVPVLSLESLLRAVPKYVNILYLQTTAQGKDLEIVKSASREMLRRVNRIRTETYLDGMGGFEGNGNRLREWIPHMKSMGFKLVNPTGNTNKEYNAVWIRED